MPGQVIAERFVGWPDLAVFVVLGAADVTAVAEVVVDVVVDDVAAAVIVARVVAVVASVTDVGVDGSSDPVFERVIADADVTDFEAALGSAD